MIYSHASGFGSAGARALLAANDHLMQALCGVEAAGGGLGQGPTYLDWGAIDVTSGWVSACSVLAGLYARRRTGHAQSVASTLIGAGLTLKSGAFLAADTVVEGPTLDLPKPATEPPTAYTWRKTAAGSRWPSRMLGYLDAPGRSGGCGRASLEPPPLRGDSGVRQPAEERLEEIFATRPAAAWVAALNALSCPLK